MTELLTVLSIIFIIAGPFLLLANYLRLPTEPALIIAGLAVGGFVDETLKLEIARLGIALLVFTFAVRIQTTDFHTAIADTEVVAFSQIAILGTIGFGAGVLLGLAPEQAIFIGIASAISSSVVGSTLFVLGEQDLMHDRLSESIHSIQDFTGLFALLVISAGVFLLDPIAQQIGYGIILLLCAIAINRHLYRLISRLSGGSGESMLIGTVALLLVFLGTAEYVGISLVVGAFAAGVAVQHDPVAFTEVFNGVESINDFFAAIFFITVGALVAYPSADVVLLTLVLIACVGVLKPLITIGLLMYTGYERRTATLTGFNLDQVGEFALIIAIEALFLGLILPSVFDAIILAAAITLITSSFTRHYDEQIYHVLADTGVLGRHGRSVRRWSDVPDDISDHIVIVGFGRHGRRLVNVCESNGVPYVVIESNPALLDELRAECRAFVFGDVVERQTVETSNLTRAQLVISTAESQPVNERLLSFSDEVDIIARARTRVVAQGYLDLGASYVLVTDLLAADYLEDRFEQLIKGEYSQETLRAEVETILETHDRTTYIHYPG